MYTTKNAENRQIGRNTCFSFYKHVYKHMKAHIWFNFFLLSHEQVSFRKINIIKERAYLEYQFKPIIIGHAAVNLKKMES